MASLSVKVHVADIQGYVINVTSMWPKIILISPVKRKCCKNPCGRYKKEFGMCGKYVAKNSLYLICVAQRRESPCGNWWLWL